jgi:hypothetical protein
LPFFFTTVRLIERSGKFDSGCTLILGDLLQIIELKVTIIPTSAVALPVVVVLHYKSTKTIFDEQHVVAQLLTAAPTVR